MTRLFGCICNQPERLAAALEPIRSVLVAQGPVSRWGLGYVQSDEVLLSRTPRRSEQDVDFYDALERVRSDYIIAHADVDDGLHGNENTQPFRYRRWLFALEGGGGGGGPEAATLQARISELVPEFLRRTIKGKTTAELVFYTLVSVLHERNAINAIDDVNLPLPELRAALAQTVEQIEHATQESGTAEPLGNFMACNSRTLVAVRLGQPLYMRRLVVPNPQRTGPRTPTTFKGILAVSTQTHPGEGFEEIPPRSILLLSRDVRPDVVPLAD